MGKMLLYMHTTNIISIHRILEKLNSCEMVSEHNTVTAYDLRYYSLLKCKLMIKIAERAEKPHT